MKEKTLKDLRQCVHGSPHLEVQTCRNERHVLIKTFYCLIKRVLMPSFLPGGPTAACSAKLLSSLVMPLVLPIVKSRPCDQFNFALLLILRRMLEPER